MTTRCLLLLGVLLVTPLSPAGAGSKEEEKERQKAYKAAVSTFLTGIQDESAATRRRAVLALKDFADMGGAELIAGKLLGREQNPRVLDAAMLVLASVRESANVEWLLEEATGRGKWMVRVPLLEALATVQADAVLGKRIEEAVTEIVEKEKDPRLLSTALWAVGTRKVKSALDAALARIDHDDWQVRVAVFEALADIGEKKAVPFLIDRLFQERGRLRMDIGDALKTLTTMDFGTDEKKWRQWLSETGGEAPPKVPEDEKPPKDPNYADDGPTYFGLKVLSERVVFVLDVSLSMKTEIDIDKMKLAREAVTTGKETEEDKDSEVFEQTIEWWKIKDRLDLAKAQLVFVIKNLRKTQRFEIITFSETVKSWNEGNLVPADSRRKRMALQFVDSVAVEGATAAGAALDFAFEMAGPGATDKNYKAGVDTVYFLSDGAPTDRAPEEILEEVATRNRLRKIKIHVIAIMNYSVAFLRLLAESAGGTYKFFQVEDKR